MNPLPLSELPAFAPALLELFPGAHSISAGSARAQTVFVPDEATQRAVAGRSANEGWLPDTIYRAAWAWAATRWCGESRVATEPIALACTGEEECTQWVTALDAAHRERSQQTIHALDLRWQADPAPALVLHLDAGLADESTAQAVLEAVAAVAVALARAPLGTPLRAIPVIAPAQQELLLRRWNAPPSAYDPARTLVSLFAQQAAARPDAPAVADTWESLSYRELDRRSDWIACRLQALGVQPGDVVGVALGRSTAAVATLLAIVKAGAAYLPLEASLPAERAAFMAEDARVRAIVATAQRAPALPAGPQVLTLAWPQDVPPGEHRPVPVAADGDAVAYIIYTSGSTGTPKGTEVCHRSVIRLVVNADYVDLSPRAVVMHSVPLGFDVSTAEIWGPLLTGGCCAVHDEDMPTGPGLARTIRAHGVTTMFTTAALFNTLIDGDPGNLRGLHQIFIGGEAISVPHVRRSLAALPDMQPINAYGPTECTTIATTYAVPHDLPADAATLPIGRPIADTTAYVTGPSLALLPPGLVGELCLGGRGVARGYVNRPELTAERFVPDPFQGTGAGRLYRTGDRARLLPGGQIDFLGRQDGQVKVRGHRIETGEIEAALALHPAIQANAVRGIKDASGSARLVAYLVAKGDPPAWPELRAFLAERLPEVMVPAAHVWLQALPLTPNGKVDRRALPTPPAQRPDIAQPFREPRDAAEAAVCAAFAAALGIDRVGRDDNFFDLGGDSLRVLKVLAQLQKGSALRLTPQMFFRRPTPQAFARALAGADDGAPISVRTGRRRGSAAEADDPVAVIAMAGRFPGADSVEQLWENLRAGRDSITRFGELELDPWVGAEQRADPAYVAARGVLEGADLFDAAFFGITPKEAAVMDPQQRIFLEVCWECLERGGYAPDACPTPVGVFAGMGNGTYLQRHLAHRGDLLDAVGEVMVVTGNEKDYIATRIAHRLDLTGPAVSLNTACSTSLVAITQAFHALRSGQCDMALAGGVSITCPPRSGYIYQEGAMLSPDGHTRTFDAEARGTVFSDGAAVVLLKPLSLALQDGDPVVAVIRGAAINNDGAHKASFTAPSVDGQAAAIMAAMEGAGVDARSISYVEAHGTATPMGDPIEIEALTQAYARHTGDTGYCAIGSIKSNVGHMVAAAGAAGLIKTALALQHESIPPTLHFERPNPSIDFGATPFRVNARTMHWPRGATPRRAGVSSFGVGGTNAHAVLEEAPATVASDAWSGPQLLTLSARTPTALQAAAARLAGHLQAHPNLSLADAGHTLITGRKAFEHRSVLVAGSTAEAVALLRAEDGPMRASGRASARLPALVFLFSGQGSQYAGMGAALHAQDRVFRQALDECLAALAPSLPWDLRARLFSDDPSALAPTMATQPALFALQYALAQRLMALGALPVALVGHSIGEFAAAVVAGVMSLDDAARLVAQRALLMQAQPAGTMLSVRLSADQLATRLPAGISLAVDNGPSASVAAGPADAIERLRTALEADGVVARTLQTSHAFHSAMMEPAMAPFEAAVRKATLSAPRIPIYSTLTGALLTPAQATDPGYWARHLRETVRFAPAARQAFETIDQAVFVEIGPRTTLTTLVRQQARADRPVRALPTLGDHPDTEVAALRLAAGRLWSLGAELDLARLDERPRKSRVLLPTYPFERKRYWIEARPAGAPGPAAPATAPALSPSIPPELSMTSAPTAPASPPARIASLNTRLRTLFEEISGIPMSQVDGGTPFVELGLDSLTLTQVAMQVKRTLKVNLSFRQLMETYRSFDALAAFLHGALPPEPATPAATPAASTMAPTAAVPSPVVTQQPLLQPAALAAGGSLVQQVIAQQMLLMQQQLALLSAAPTVPASPVLPVPPAEQATPRATAAAPASNTVPPAAAAPAAAEPEAAAPVKYDVKKAFGAIARIHTQNRELTDRQKVRLSAFMRRYSERTAGSKAFTDANRPHMADPRVVNGFRPATKEITYQIVIERSKGSRVWDIDGNEYVDVLNGFGMNLFGWQPDFVQEAVRRQLELGYEIGPQHPLAADVTRLVCELTGFDRAGLCNTGSEAVMAAIRIARTVTGRSTIVTFTGDYHGTFDEVLVRAGRRAQGMPAAPGVMPGMFGDIRVLDYGTPEALAYIREHADELAAVLVEPIQSRRPEFQPRDFLREVRAITEKSQTCLIFDEVITGFRSQLGGAQALYGIRADLASYGKVIGGGFPVGVIAGKREYMDALDGGAWQYGDDSMPSVGVTYFAGTFVRHPLALAACKASLEHLKKSGETLQTQLNLHTAALADELTAFCREVGAPIEIRYFASLWRVTWLEDHPLQDLLFAMMRSHGVHILDNFPCFMTTAHTQEDIATIKSAFKQAVAELQEAEFLPRRAAPAKSFDASHPPVPNARLGRDKEGHPAWFIPDPNVQGKFIRMQQA